MTTRQSTWQGSKWIRPEKRQAIYVRDGLACVYCGATIENGRLALDHVIPHSDGGGNGAENLVTACGRCNSSRGNRPAAEFAGTVAVYLNHGITAAQILTHITACLSRPIDVQAAKKIKSKE